jgi:transcriptional regulator with PAS, ATPase and Fis domain
MEDLKFVVSKLDDILDSCDILLPQIQKLRANLVQTIGERSLLSDEKTGVNDVNRLDLHGRIALVNVDAITHALNLSDNNTSKAARLLGLNSPQTLTNRMLKYGVSS